MTELPGLKINMIHSQFFTFKQASFMHLVSLLVLPLFFLKPIWYFHCEFIENLICYIQPSTDFWPQDIYIIHTLKRNMFQDLALHN